MILFVTGFGCWVELGWIPWGTAGPPMSPSRSKAPSHEVQVKSGTDTYHRTTIFEKLVTSKV